MTNVSMTVLTQDIPTRAVSSREFAALLVEVSHWQRDMSESEEEVSEQGFMAQRFFGRGDHEGEVAAVSMRQGASLHVSESNGKAVVTITRMATVEWIDLFSFDDWTGERIVPATSMFEAL